MVLGHIAVAIIDEVPLEKIDPGVPRQGRAPPFRQSELQRQKRFLNNQVEDSFGGPRSSLLYLCMKWI